MKRLLGALIGTGFFASMQMAAWQNISAANIVGRFTLEGRQGEVMLNRKLQLYMQLNNGKAYEHAYENPSGYKGGSCESTQRHFVQALLADTTFETNGEDYLKTLAVVEAVYESAASQQAVKVNYDGVTM